MSDRIHGFLPVYDSSSRLLILGSFPSVKSRKIDFYYGNKQNRFWEMLFGYFKEEVKESTAEKKEFLFRRHIALWDIVTECEIEGSSDASIKSYEIADVPSVLLHAPIECIFLNGGMAYKIFCERYAGIEIPYYRLPSTSPANPRYDEGVWRAALDRIFYTT